MANTKQLSVIVLALGASACVPMEQATLTYTSKTTMGVGVAAGTQETPGLDVAIGFRETNVALVPVAVAKYCYKAKEKLCQDTIYHMKLIAGGKLDSVENQPVEKRIAEINEELSRLIDEQKRDTDRLGELRSKITVSEAAELASTELAKLGTAAQDESAEIQSRRADLTAKASTRPAGFDVGQARLEVAQIEADQLSRTSLMATRREEQDALTKQLASNSNRTRQDAFSVYGKFNGGAGGNGQGASLTAGKIFATGLAAQNLTEFATTSDCLGNIRLLADMMPAGNDTAKVDLLASAVKVCKPGL